jgi:membrane protease YdiL (CAAX protease family)
MKNNNSKGVSYTAGFFILIGVALAGLAIASLVGGALLVWKAGGSVADVKSIMTDPANASMLRWIQVVSVIFSMFLPAVLVAYILNRRPFQLLGYRKQFNLKQFGIVLALVFVSIFIAGSLGYLNKDIPVPAEWKTLFDQMEKDYAQQVGIMASFNNVGAYLSSLLLLAFLPALCEETLFRGGLQNFLTRATKKPWLAILIVSVIFSLVHFSFYGFLPRMFLGAVLGLIYYLTQNIWLSITAHFLNNALALTQLYIANQQGKDLSKVMNEDIGTYYWGFIAIPLLVLLFLSLKKTYRQKQIIMEEAGGNDGF